MIESLTKHLGTNQYQGDNVGSRLQTYLMTPMTCSFTFYVASDNNWELNLSTDTDPSNRVKIAYSMGYSANWEWFKYTSEKSETISLVKR